MRRFAALPVLAVLAVLVLAGCTGEATAAPDPTQTVSPAPSPSATFSITAAVAEISEASTIEESIEAVLALDAERFGAASTVLDAISGFETAVEKHLSDDMGRPFRVELIKVYGDLYDDMTVEATHGALYQLQDIAKQVREAI